PAGSRDACRGCCGPVNSPSELTTSQKTRSQGMSAAGSLSPGQAGVARMVFMAQRPRMIFNAFNMFTASHHDQGMWAWPGSRQLEYNDVGYWVEVARLLERGMFD